MNINNSSMDSQVYNLIKKSLDAASLSSKVSANNIANVNTKGYKKYNVSFQETLKENIDSLALKTTDAKHIKLNEENGQISVKQDTSTSMRQDGNNVDIDNEMTNQAANSLMYNAMIAEINNKLSNSRLVINGGR